MSATTPAVTTPTPATLAADPAIFKVLEDGTVLYKTYRQAAHAKQRKAATESGDATKKLSQVKYGDNYLAKDGQVAPYTLGNLIEFQLTGLIVVLVVLVGLSLICSLIGRLITTVDKKVPGLPATAPAIVPSPSPAPASGIHPGLTDQQLVVLLTAAATEAIGGPVRIGSFRAVNNRGGNWAAQGRSELQSHRLK